MAMSEQYGIIDDNDVNQNIHRRLKDYGFSRPLHSSLGSKIVSHDLLIYTLLLDVGFRVKSTTSLCCGDG